jgi:hypothetical protein
VVMSSLILYQLMKGMMLTADICVCACVRARGDDSRNSKRVIDVKDTCSSAAIDNL